MDITTDGDRAPDWLHVGFFHQYLPRLCKLVSVDRKDVASYGPCRIVSLRLPLLVVCIG